MLLQAVGYTFINKAIQGKITRGRALNYRFIATSRVPEQNRDHATHPLCKHFLILLQVNASLSRTLVQERAVCFLKVDFNMEILCLKGKPHSLEEELLIYNCK